MHLGRVLTSFATFVRVLSPAHANTIDTALSSQEYRALDRIIGTGAPVDIEMARWEQKEAPRKEGLSLIHI